MCSHADTAIGMCSASKCVCIQLQVAKAETFVVNLLQGDSREQSEYFLTRLMGQQEAGARQVQLFFVSATYPPDVKQYLTNRLPQDISAISEVGTPVSYIHISCCLQSGRVHDACCPAAAGQQLASDKTQVLQLS